MIWFLLLLGAGAWLWWRRSRLQMPDIPTEIGFEPPPISSTTIIAEVKCVTVTQQRQEWRSIKTGRRYDVLSANGVAGAKKGDRGLVIKMGSGWRVIAEDDLPSDE